MTAEDTSARLAGTWAVTEVADAVIPDGIAPTLVFSPDQVAGFAGCNNFGAPATYEDGGKLAFDGARITRMACEPEIMTFEAAMIRAVERVSDVAFDGADRITLTGFGVFMLRATRLTGG